MIDLQLRYFRLSSSLSISIWKFHLILRKTLRQPMTHKVDMRQDCSIHPDIRVPGNELQHLLKWELFPHLMFDHRGPETAVWIGLVSISVSPSAIFVYVRV